MLVKWNPFNALATHEPFWSDFFDADFPLRVNGFEPKVDIKETDKDFVINTELPGLDKNDFKLTVEDNVLTIEGEKKIENEEKNENYYRSERSYGAFKRSFRLTDSVDSKNINAKYKNGILSVTIPKTEKAKPKTVEVKVS